jgi:hypothetical protein
VDCFFQKHVSQSVYAKRVSPYAFREACMQSVHAYTGFCNACMQSMFFIACFYLLRGTHFFSKRVCKACTPVCFLGKSVYLLTCSENQIMASSGWICARCFQFITEAYGRWKIIIFMTHLFNNARKASLASRVPSFCLNISPK